MPFEIVLFLPIVSKMCVGQASSELITRAYDPLASLALGSAWR